MSGERTYQSPLREAQAAMTRERILMAAKDYLEQHSIDSLTLRKVAALSGVSPPTVYSHFPAMDDLVGAFFLWLKPRVAFDKPPPPLAELHTMPARQFPLYEQHGALLRNLMNQSSWDRNRYADRDNRLSGWAKAVSQELPNLTPTQLRRGGLACASFWSPTYWRWLRDTCCFSPEEAKTVATWGIRAVITALKTDAAGLDQPLPGATSR